VKQSGPYSLQAHLWPSEAGLTAHRRTCVKQNTHTSGYKQNYVCNYKEINARTAGRPALTHHPHPHYPMWQVPAVPARCPTDAAWLGAPVPTVPFTPPPPHRRWPPPHLRWPQPSDSAGSLSKCKGRREQRGEEDQSAEGGSVAKRIQVQKVAVAPAIPAAPSAAPCTQTPHTKRVGRRWARGGSRAGHMFPRRVCPVLT